MVKEDFKETEFNSSIATLKRIDALITQIHMARTIHDNQLYSDLLYALYVEGSTKMTNEEKKKCQSFLDEVHTTYYDCKRKKTNTYTMCSLGGTQRQNKRIDDKIIYLRRIRPICEMFELFLMKCLDVHGMLIKDKKDTDETPDDW